MNRKQIFKKYNIHTILNVVNPRETPLLPPSRTARQVNPRWAYLISYALNGNR
jgi:hypothetical protein